MFASETGALGVAVLLLVSTVDVAESSGALSSASKVNATEVAIEVAERSLLGTSVGEIRLPRLHAEITSSDVLMISSVFFFIEVLL